MSSDFNSLFESLRPKEITILNPMDRECARVKDNVKAKDGVASQVKKRIEFAEWAKTDGQPWSVY